MNQVGNDVAHSLAKYGLQIQIDRFNFWVGYPLCGLENALEIDRSHVIFNPVS